MRPAVALAGLLLIAGLVVSRPLAVEWADGLPLTAQAPADTAVLWHFAGDTLQLYYQLWLLRDGLFGPTPLFMDPYQFRVNGPRWNLPQSFPPLSVPFALLSPLGFPAAYNLLVLLSFPLAGLAAYALVRHHTGHPLGAAAAGAAFALAPARLDPLFGGQPAGFAAALVPLVIWGLDRAVTRGDLWGGLGGGAALAALATLEPHYTYLIGGLAVVYAPFRWVTAAPGWRVPWRPVIGFGVLATVGVGWLLLLRQAFLAGSIAEAGRTLEEVRLFSPGLPALRLPETYGGLLAGALALVGLAGLRERASLALRLGYGAVLTAGLVLSLGPTLPGVPLYQALHRWLPLFALMRNPEKFRILVSLAVVVLAGYGARALAERLPSRAAGTVGLALVVLVAAETAPWHAIAVTRLPDNPLYAALRAEARRVLYLPIWPGDSAWSSMYLYHVTRTRVPTVNGYSPLVPREYVADVFETLQALNVGELGPAEHAALRRLGVTHVVLDRGVFPPKVSPFPSAFTREGLRSSPGLALEHGLDPLWLFRVSDQPPTGLPRATSPVGLFYEAETLSRHTGNLAADASGSGGQVVTARPEVAPPGFLAFGPYRFMPAGSYRATFRTRGRGLTVDIAVDLGQRVLAERRVAPTDEWAEVALAFTLERAQRVEFRVRWDGNREAAVDWISVVFADRPEPEWTFEVEDLPHQLVGERPDPAASGGWAGYADPVKSRRIHLLSGPARRFPASQYRIVLRARADAAAQGPLLELSVTEPAGRTLASRTVDAAELPPGGYLDVGLDFALAAPAVLEFPVAYLGGTGIFFDRLTVEPR